MQKRKIYLYIKGDIEGIRNIFYVFEEIQVNQFQEHILEIITEQVDVKELIQATREVTLGELYQDFTAFIEPLDFDFPVQDILNLLPDFTPSVYTIEQLIPEMVFLSKWQYLKRLKNYYYSKFNSETIETVLGFIDHNLNATKTAKTLFMHRNTLNYRLDNFVRKTEIDVRTFTGALSIYLLFRR